VDTSQRGVFPDTMLPFNKPYLLPIEAKKRGAIYSSVSDIDRALNLVLPEGMLSIYVFDFFEIEKNDWSIVSNDYLIKKRLNYSIGALKEADYIINYND
jgi:hypothetical protein